VVGTVSSMPECLSGCVGLLLCVGWFEGCLRCCVSRSEVGGDVVDGCRGVCVMCCCGCVVMWGCGVGICSGEASGAVSVLLVVYGGVWCFVFGVVLVVLWLRVSCVCGVVSGRVEGRCVVGMWVALYICEGEG
jgi:hypothetical protein